jgi:hypothetical protein
VSLELQKIQTARSTYSRNALILKIL